MSNRKKGHGRGEAPPGAFKWSAFSLAGGEFIQIQVRLNAPSQPLRNLDRGKGGREGLYDGKRTFIRLSERDRQTSRAAPPRNLSARFYAPPSRAPKKWLSVGRPLEVA